MSRPPHPRTAAFAQGFTLIEVMIVVAVIGILSSIAYPVYTGYVLRGKIIEATASLQGLQADMERHYQNKRDYAGAAACNSRKVGNFTTKCTNSDENGYELEAAGEKFTFTINQRNERTSQEDGKSKQIGCWILGKGQEC